MFDILFRLLSQFRGSSGQHGPYGDAVQELDWGVGQVLDAVERAGLSGNTLVYFTSDNGGHLEDIDHAGRRAGGHNGIFGGEQILFLIVVFRN
jgi:arylsulfatase A-like enzyme